MSADWQAGDRAVCVDDSPGRVTGLKVLEKGTVYLVEDTIVCPYSGELVLYIAGVFTGLNPHGLRYGFYPLRFRKLVPACDLARRHAEGVGS